MLFFIKGTTTYESLGLRPFGGQGHRSEIVTQKIVKLPGIGLSAFLNINLMFSRGLLFDFLHLFHIFINSRDQFHSFIPNSNFIINEFINHLFIRLSSIRSFIDSFKQFYSLSFGCDISSNISGEITPL